MQTDSLLKQSSERGVDLASLRGGTFHHAPINARRAHFDSVTIAVHWVTVVVVLALFATAWLHALAEERHSNLTPLLLQIHRSLGVTVWAVTALRLAWRLTSASLPPFPPQMTALQRATVKLSEYALYALLLGQPVTGMLTTLFGGRPFALFGWQVPQLIARHDVLRDMFHSWHEVGAWTFAILVLGHAGTALFHHFVLRDDVLECMLRR